MWASLGEVACWAKHHTKLRAIPLAGLPSVLSEADTSSSSRQHGGSIQTIWPDLLHSLPSLFSEFGHQTDGVALAPVGIAMRHNEGVQVYFGVGATLHEEEVVFSQVLHAKIAHGKRSVVRHPNVIEYAAALTVQWDARSNN